MRGALLNPIRFYRADDMPDYLTIFPNFDNTTYGEVYFYGVAASPDCIREHVGDMYLQFVDETNTGFTFDIYKLNDENVFEAIDTVDSVDISPVGWVTDQIHKVTLTGLADGIYYLNVDDYTSDVFRITSSTIATQDLVKVKYLNTYNDFGCIFGTNYFEAYFRGNIKKGESKIDVEAFESDRGIPVKLRATPQRTASLNILGLHQNYKELVEMIFSCNDITINGVAYENMEAPSFDAIEGSDLANMAIKLVQTNNDYYHG
jgi:hypothetical protein